MHINIQLVTLSYIHCNLDSYYLHLNTTFCSLLSNANHINVYYRIAFYLPCLDYFLLNFFSPICVVQLSNVRQEINWQFLKITQFHTLIDFYADIANVSSIFFAIGFRCLFFSDINLCSAFCFGWYSNICVCHVFDQIYLQTKSENRICCAHSKLGIAFWAWKVWLLCWLAYCLKLFRSTNLPVYIINSLNKDNIMCLDLMWIWWLVKVDSIW